jgi:hypothetical protein
MKRIATVVALLTLIAAPAAMAQTSFGWTISNSTVDPLSNSGPIAPGAGMFSGNLYLWYFCNVAGNIAAAEFDIAESAGGGAPTGFNGMNGFLNAGNATALLLAVGGCPSGPVLAGAFTVGPDQFIADIELCMVNSAANNRNITVTCPPQQGIPNFTIGFRKSTAPSCISLTPATCTTGVDANSWGQIKGLYR